MLKRPIYREAFMDASEVKGLKLLGFWASPFSLEVEVALKLKGILYDYQEENLEEGKSVSLLHYNPIYKCVPVLIHDGRPIVESLVILEYLEEISSDHPLLPADPYSRARVRFWVDFFYNKLVPPLRSIVVKEGEEQEKVITETKERLRNFEHGIEDDFPAETQFLVGDSPGLLDILLGSTVCWIRVLQELTGSELMSQDTTPVICRRMKAFAELQAVKDAVPDHEMLLAYTQRLRKRFLGPNSN